MIADSPVGSRKTASKRDRRPRQHPRRRVLLDPAVAHELRQDRAPPHLLQHRRIGLGQRHERPERGPAGSPLFQVMFTFRRSLPLPSMTGLEVTELELETGTAKFDLSLDLVDHGSRVAATFEYATDLFDLATIERAAGHYRTLLEGIVADPDRRIRDLPLLTGAERRALLE